MNPDDYLEKRQREKMAAANQECGEIRGIPAPSSHGGYYTNAMQGETPRRTFTLKEEAEKRYSEHSAQMQKAQQAFDFLSANPAFDEFVRLVRAGVIQF
jgi:hypothetical protein